MNQLLGRCASISRSIRKVQGVLAINEPDKYRDWEEPHDIGDRERGNHEDSENTETEKQCIPNLRPFPCPFLELPQADKRTHTARTENQHESSYPAIWCRRYCPIGVHDECPPVHSHETDSNANTSWWFRSAILTQTRSTCCTGSTPLTGHSGHLTLRAVVNVWACFWYRETLYLSLSRLSLPRRFLCNTVTCYETHDGVDRPPRRYSPTSDYIGGTIRQYAPLNDSMGL